MTRRRLLYVEWVDSSSGATWVGPGDLAPPCLCRSVGWIIKEDADWLYLAGTVQVGDSEVCQRITIPKRSITRRRRIGLT